MTAHAAAARFVGKRVTRKEDGRLITGRGTYVDDVVLPGMLHVAFARSPVARARILSIDISAARDMPGVEAIFLAGDFDRFDAKPLGFDFSEGPLPIPLLARDSVKYVGDPYAVVVARDRYLAEDAASLIDFDYEEEDPVITMTDARQGKLVHAEAESNCALTFGANMDAERQAVFSNAPYSVSRTIIHPRVSQSPMETRGIVAARQGDSELLIHMSCQSPHFVARYITHAINLGDIQVRVLSKDVGGSFGLKIPAWREEMAVVCAALLLGRPVKWIEDRWENLVAANSAREQEITTHMAFDHDGRILAAHVDYHVNNGAYPHGPDAGIALHMFMWLAYKVPTATFLSQGWYTNTVGNAAYRGPWAMESLARETLLDIAAHEMGIDPIELRRRNLIGAADQPLVSAMQLPIEGVTTMECLDLLLEQIDIPAFRREQAEARERGEYLGLGCATYVEPTALSGMTPMTGELAHVRVEPSGKVTAQMSTHSQGHGLHTTIAQVIADELGVPYEDVTVHSGDSASGGFSPGAVGSRQGVIGNGAALTAAGQLKAKIKTVAAHLLNAQPEHIRIEDGLVKVEGVDAMVRSLRQIAEIAYGEPGRLPAGMESGLEAQVRYDPPPVTLTSAAHACIVRIDGTTGFVKVERWISSEDCGTIINPAIVEGQIAGGLAQGIGSVLYEEAGYDERGNPLAVTYKDYHLPLVFDMPDIEYHHASTPSKATGGYRGVGEGGAIIGPPTLVNAIADALAPFGEIELHLPLSPTKILEVIERGTA